VLEMGSVGHAKQQIVRKTGMPMHLLHVWHAGKELLDDSVHVMRYGVEDGSHLHMLVTGLGGLDEDDVQQLDNFVNKSKFDFEGNQRALILDTLDGLDQLQEVKDSDLDELGFTSTKHKLRFRQIQRALGGYSTRTSLPPQQGTSPLFVLSCVPLVVIFGCVHFVFCIETRARNKTRLSFLLALSTIVVVHFYSLKECLFKR
jgi:hypothetical protein